MEYVKTGWEPAPCSLPEAAVETKNAGAEPGVPRALRGGGLAAPRHTKPTHTPPAERQGWQMDRRRRGAWASGRHRRACCCRRDKASETKARPTPVAPGRVAAFLCRSGCSCQLSRASSYRGQTSASACRAQRWKEEPEGLLSREVNFSKVVLRPTSTALHNEQCQNGEDGSMVNALTA